MSRNFNVPDGYFMRRHKIRIYPNQEQKMFINKYIDIDRTIYNWGLSLEIKQESLYLYDESDIKHLNFFKLEKEYTKFRNSNEWMKDVPHATGKSGLYKLDEAYHRYKLGISNHPKYKSKKSRKHTSFYTRSNRLSLKNGMLKIEGLRERIYTKSNINIDNNQKIYATLIFRDNRNYYWFVYSTMEKKFTEYFVNKKIPEMDRAIGIDLNKNKRFALSNGINFYTPKKFDYELSKLKRRQREISRDINRQKKLERTNPDEYQDKHLSKRAKKRFKRYQKQSKRVANINENFIQTTTKKIIDMHPKAIVMEDLVVKDHILKNKAIAKNVFWSTFRRCRDVMEYKANMYNIPFILAPKDYPSSQICSCCGNRIGNKFNYYKNARTIHCPVCGSILDRDLNAAINLEHLAYL